jgi:hypothetical protein
MRKIKKICMGLSITLLSSTSFAQEIKFKNLSDNVKILEPLSKFDVKFQKADLKNDLTLNLDKQRNYNNSKLDFKMNINEGEPFLRNRRNLYSSMWAFASLNYIYADLTGLMDKNILAQYQNGVVNGTKITPNFLGVAAGFMQISLANVFLPQVIKNESTLRWVQIASGTLMTLVQAGTLFVGKPAPSYMIYSAVEIAATTFITIDAIKWKVKSNKKKLVIE